MCSVGGPVGAYLWECRRTSGSVGDLWECRRTSGSVLVGV